MNYDDYDDGYDDGYGKEPDDLECPDCDSTAITDFAEDPTKYRCEYCGAIFRSSVDSEF
jgi:rubredoxin